MRARRFGSWRGLAY
jgi:hypothetical protein